MRRLSGLSVDKEPDMSYFYPDKNDRITEDLIRKVSKGDYWRDSEERVLAIAKEQIETLPRPRRMLDLGCGLGRLFRVFAPVTDSILGLEPDPERCAGAKESAAALPEDEITVLNRDSSALKDDQIFDVILSSHVLQHIPQKLCEDMIAEMKSHTRPGSLVILTTTHTDRPEDVFSKEIMKEEQRHSEEVGAAEFENLFSQEGVLPVRLFAETTLIGLFRKNDFALAARRRFHYDGADSVDYDDAANEEIYGKSSADADLSLPAAKKFTANARDCFYIFQRRT